MTLTEILQHVGQLTHDERASLSRELKEMMSSHEVEAAAPAVHEQVDKSRSAASEESGVPTEDVVGQPRTAEDHA